jgi:hypothetical protein
VLDALARALQLDEAERAYLFDLARAASTTNRGRRPPRQQVRPPHSANVRVRASARRCLSIGAEQGQALARGQVPRGHDEKVPPVKGRDLAQVESLGQRNNACIHHLRRRDAYVVSSSPIRR